MKPISEWTDAELRDYCPPRGYECGPRFAAEVLRLRGVIVDMDRFWAREAETVDILAEKLEAMEENLAFAQQRAADNDLRARLGEAKIAQLREELRSVGRMSVDRFCVEGTCGCTREAHTVFCCPDGTCR